ncbi:MAG: hypothetical protein SGPRY_013693 [Prymnesium sp.]
MGNQQSGAHSRDCAIPGLPQPAHHLKPHIKRSSFKLDPSRKEPRRPSTNDWAQISGMDDEMDAFLQPPLPPKRLTSAERLRTPQSPNSHALSLPKITTAAEAAAAELAAAEATFGKSPGAYVDMSAVAVLQAGILPTEENSGSSMPGWPDLPTPVTYGPATVRRLQRRGVSNNHGFVRSSARSEPTDLESASPERVVEVTEKQGTDGVGGGEGIPLEKALGSGGVEEVAVLATSVEEAAMVDMIPATERDEGATETVERETPTEEAEISKEEKMAELSAAQLAELQMAERVLALEAAAAERVQADREKAEKEAAERAEKEAETARRAEADRVAMEARMAAIEEAAAERAAMLERAAEQLVEKEKARALTAASEQAAAEVVARAVAHAQVGVVEEVHIASAAAARAEQEAARMQAEKEASEAEEARAREKEAREAAEARVKETEAREKAAKEAAEARLLEKEAKEKASKEAEEALVKEKAAREAEEARVREKELRDAEQARLREVKAREVKEALEKERAAREGEEARVRQDSKRIGRESYGRDSWLGMEITTKAPEQAASRGCTLRADTGAPDAAEHAAAVASLKTKAASTMHVNTSSSPLARCNSANDKDRLSAIERSVQSSVQVRPSRLGSENDAEQIDQLEQGVSSRLSQRETTAPDGVRHTDHEQVQAARRSGVDRVRPSLNPMPDEVEETHTSDVQSASKSCGASTDAPPTNSVIHSPPARHSCRHSSRNSARVREAAPDVAAERSLPALKPWQRASASDAAQPPVDLIRVKPDVDMDDAQPSVKSLLSKFE